ncbi:YqcI/YcgG family protein [Endozoicomonas acroporae]|uniref:YqcI/YcgG family protein n=1 Tax=Endozoicomonas acroporae TaxID=1701104 RepID=UPI003D7BD3F6
MYLLFIENLPHKKLKIKMNKKIEKSFKVLYEQDVLSKVLNESSGWKKEAWMEFSAKLKNKDFPCLFGKKAFKSKSIKVVFCEKKDYGVYDDFLQGLIEYTDYVINTPQSERIFLH